MRGGQYQVVYEPLTAMDNGLVYGSSADQSATLQRVATAVATNTSGGILDIPPGVYHMGSSTIAIPHGTPVHLRGAGGSGWSGLGQANNATQLKWDSDPAGIATESVAGLSLQGSSQRVSGINFVGPNTYHQSGQNGVRISALGGVQIQGSCAVDHCSFSGFGVGILIGGQGVSGDHWNIDHISSTCSFGLFMANGTNTSGDVHMSHLRIQAKLAAIGLSSTSGILSGGDMTSCGLYGPYGFMSWDDGTPGDGYMLDSLTFDGVNIESPGNGCIFDENYYQGSTSSVNNLRLSSGFLGNIADYGYTWTATCPVVSTSGSQITVTVPAGFVVRPNMDVIGDTWTLRASSIVSGAWPTTTYVLALSGTPSSTPSTVTLRMPRVGKIVVGGSVTRCQLAATALANAYPLIVAGGRVQTNTSLDGTDALTTAQEAGIVRLAGSQGTPAVTGNQWGTAGAGTTSLTSSAVPKNGTAIAQYDLVETYASGNLTYARPATGASIPVGVAQQATAPGSAVDLLVSAPSATVANKASAQIASGSLLKPDATHPGGVTTASSWGDGPIVGQALGTIAGTSTGQASIHCH